MFQQSPIKAELESFIKTLVNVDDSSNNDEQIQGVSDAIYLSVTKRMSIRSVDLEINEYVSDLIADNESASNEFKQISYHNE